jgi:hypothetical protein
MPPKKAAKKIAMKSANKHDAHKAARDARRAFEHLGRVQSIVSVAVPELDAIHALTSLADTAVRAQRYKESADLLRAAEHLSFASMVVTDGSRLSESLVEAIREEFDHLLERAGGHGDATESPAEVRKIYGRMTKNAADAMRRKAYRTALELARGAEALTHVGVVDEKILDADKPTRRLKG